MKFEVEIFQDPCPENPRTLLNWGEILYSSYRYVLGDKKVESQEIDMKLADPTVIALPVYAYIHSGVMLDTAPFGCQWDGGQSGCIYVSKEVVKEEYGVKRISSRLSNKVEERLKAEVKEYSQYFAGDVWAYRISKDGEEIDSCYGIWDKKEAQRMAMEVFEKVLRT